MTMQTVQLVPRDGLGFPILPIVMGASAVAGLFTKKGGAKLTEADAKKAVQQVFLELLERDPWRPEKYDKGAEGYVECLLRREDKSLGDARFGPGTCNLDDVRTNVLQSDEYRRLQEKKAAAVYGVAPGASGLAPGAAPGLFPAAGAGGISTMTVAGIPVVYLGAGLLLLMLMKR